MDLLKDLVDKEIFGVNFNKEEEVKEEANHLKVYLRNSKKYFRVERQDPEEAVEENKHPHPREKILYFKWKLILWKQLMVVIKLFNLAN